ncbi:hypothetical protein ACJQWK_06878 [Exserohilum turcicum]|uniref:Uncharacterized protein n=1 Tax=Exserohilum turcicum (strain 28A) TaxID=671987 RepID=R0K5J2_EXST2|nr:uncharacterized protein SETTUDRAFT_20319 [Exserohilum turcica Et28A]EOA84794.1 hypothetical protein SETTUDRAFT_20319 [Exserohilum turcica Et28A]
MADDSKSSKAGWSDQSWYTQVAPPTPSTTNYEQLSSLLYLITKQDVTLKWDEGCYPADRNANGFRQKINALKRTFKSDWDAMSSGAPVPSSTPKKAASATPRKRKNKSDEDLSGAEPKPKKARGKSKPKNATPEMVDEDDEDESSVKEEIKEEQLDTFDSYV